MYLQSSVQLTLAGLWRLFLGGAGRPAGRTLSLRAGRISLTNGTPPDVYFTSPGRDSTGDAIRHDTGRIDPKGEESMQLQR